MTLVNKPKRATSNHRKRGGKHHKHTDSYVRHYWPYLPMLLIVAVGVLVNSVWSSQANILGAASDFTTGSLLQSTNQQRSNSQARPLALSNQLSAAAQAKANDMAAHNYWSHNSPDGRTPWSFITGAGYNYQSAGENLAYGFGNANDTVGGWMNSPTHRANIMNTSYSDVGFGIAQSANFQGQGPATIVVAEYGQPVGSAPGATGVAGDQNAQLVAAKSQPVSRIQLLTNGQAGWSTVALAAIGGAAVMWLIIRNGMRLKRLALEGESFILHHPLLDITLVFVGTMAIVFAQASGTIH